MLTYYLLHANGKRDDAGVASYFNDIRQSMESQEAEKRFLRGPTRESLATEVQNYCRKLGLTLRIDIPPVVHAVPPSAAKLKTSTCQLPIPPHTARPYIKN